MNAIDFPAVKPVQQKPCRLPTLAGRFPFAATLYSEINNGRLRSYTLGTRRYIAVKALHAEFIAAREAGPPQSLQAAA